MAGNRKLGRKTAQRMLMLRGLVTYLLEHGKIETSTIFYSTCKRHCDISTIA